MKNNETKEDLLLEDDVIESLDVDDIADEIDNKSSKVDEDANIIPVDDQSTETSSETKDSQSDNIAPEEKYDSDEKDLVVSIGEDSSEDEEDKKAPKWVKELRKSNRELKKRNKELENKLNSAPTNSTPKLPQKPKFEDFDYDQDQYEAALESWFEKKKSFDKFKDEEELEKKRQDEEWQESVKSYNNSKSLLKVNDFEDAEEDVQAALSEMQQGLIVKGSDNPALVVYALGKNSSVLNKISSIKDPVKFAFAVSKLEAKMKVNNMKKPPAPESVVKSTVSSNSVDSTLERLRAEAERTGDYTKVMAFKRKLRSKGK